MNRSPARLVSLACLRQSYRKRTPIETLVVQKGNSGNFFLQFRFRHSGRACAYESAPFPATDPAEAAAAAEVLQYDILNGDVLEELTRNAEVKRTKAALELKIESILRTVPEGTLDVITSRVIHFAPDTFQPILAFWGVTTPTAYRARYEPELSALIVSLNECVENLR